MGRGWHGSSRSGNAALPRSGDAELLHVCLENDAGTVRAPRPPTLRVCPAAAPHPDRSPSACPCVRGADATDKQRLVSDSSPPG